jgi:transcriptional regulator with XRE-family HTH domain
VKLMGSRSGGRVGAPYGDTSLVRYISKQIDIQASLGKNQAQIAREIGYKSPNMISMCKRGEVMVPLKKIPELARALNVEPTALFKLAIEQHCPEAHKEINAMLNCVLTENEIKVISLFRETTKDENPEITPELQRRLTRVFA